MLVISDIAKGPPSSLAVEESWTWGTFLALLLVLKTAGNLDFIDQLNG